MNINTKTRALELLEFGKKFTFENNSQHSGSDRFSKASEDFIAYVAEVEDFIISNFGIDSVPFQVFGTVNKETFTGYYQDQFESHRTRLMASLKSCMKILPKKSDTSEQYHSDLINLFQKFHLVVRQLKSRYNNRSTLDVNDEYDVQDLLHALLRIYFDDVRAEEWTPSYAGGSSRMDFLLKSEKTVIEVKKTRVGLNDKELGKQLLEDKEKYKVHPDCHKLICFTYDPDGRIINPKGIVNDLNSKTDEFEVQVIIMP
jgi:hypothetical protein